MEDKNQSSDWQNDRNIDGSYLNVSPVLKKSDNPKKIHLEDMSEALRAAGAIGARTPPRTAVPPDKIVPANPPAKTVGVIGTIKPQDQTKDLQSAVAEITSAPQTPTKTDIENQGLKTIRTYEGDIAEVMSHKKTSRASIAIAESVKESGNESIGEENVEPSYIGKKVLIAILSLVFIGIGITGAYYLYTLSPLYPSASNTTTQQQNSVSIISADSNKVINVDNLDANQIMSIIKDEMSGDMPGKTIKEIILTKTYNEQKYRVTATDMISLFEIPAPDILKRSTTDNWMMGIYNDENERKSLFIITTNNFFQNAFAGMLQWEPLMADDIRQYIRPGVAGIASLDIIINNSATSTGIISTTSTSTTSMNVGTSTRSLASTTSTPDHGSSTTSSNPNGGNVAIQSITPSLTMRGQFKDRIIKNKDVREFITPDGRLLFLYSFVDNSKLVITDSEATLGEIIYRLDKRAFIH